MLSSNALDALWVAMADIYGHRWTSAYGTDPQAAAGSTWARGLAGIAPHQVGAGIDACIAGSDPWPPTLPEFRGYCLGIPSLATVRHELHQDTPTRSLFTVLVWQGIDGYAFRLASRENGDRMIRDAYELAREHVMRGGALPEAPVAAITQEAPAPVKPLSPEQAAERMAEIRRLLAEGELTPEPQAVEVADDPRPLAEVEAELVRHYGTDRKSQAAGEGA